MNVAYGESYEIIVYRRIPNSDYQYEEKPYATFFARAANNAERKTYRLQTGVHTNDESLYLIATNMPDCIKPQDKCIFNGAQYTVESTGYYFTNSRIVNNHIMKPSYISKRAPKGITLQ